MTVFITLIMFLNLDGVVASYWAEIRWRTLKVNVTDFSVKLFIIETCVNLHIIVTAQIAWAFVK